MAIAQASTKIDVFKYKNYHSYLADQLSGAQAERGVRARLATFLGCQQSYLSRVLNEQAHLSPEQSHGVSLFFHHNEHETKYFMFLVFYTRAGTESLKKYWALQMQEVKEKSLLLKNRVELSQTLNENQQMTYYSAWYYSAVHVLVSIPRFQTLQSLVEHLQMPKERLLEVLDFLQRSGLVTVKNGKYNVGTTQIHLDQESPLISQHHTNWKIQTIRSLQTKTHTDLHYSSIVSLSEEDVLEVRGVLVQAIEKIRARVRQSPEEKAVCYSLDLFSI